MRGSRENRTLEQERGRKKEFLDKVKKRPKALKKEERGDDFLLEGVTR